MTLYTSKLRWKSAAVLALFVGLLSLSSVQAANKKAANYDRVSLSNIIDQSVKQTLKDEEVPASTLSSDAEFLRRAYLDLVGVIPDAKEAKAFLDSNDEQKRAKLIDQLLNDSRFGKNMADVWQRRLITETSDVRRLNRKPLIDWLTEQFNSNTAWNKLVYDLITATGEQNKNGAVTYFLGNSTIDRITDSVTRQFLGVQLQCAQCHDHPFTEWTQNEYWGMAMFFKKVAIDNPNRAAKDGSSPGVSEISLSRDPKARKKRQGKRVLRLPISAKRVEPGFVQSKEKLNLDGETPFRPVLAKWITTDENPYFAKAMINRTWAHFFGRGLINPVDDLQPGLESSHPEIMTALSEGFISNGYDVKELIRAIMNSETYQRTSKPVQGNEDADPEIYSRVMVKVMTPGQLFDSLKSVLSQGQTASRNETPQQKQRRIQLMKRRRNGASQREQFIDFFKYDPFQNPTEYSAGIPQALRMMNSREFSNFGLVNSVIREGMEPKAAIEHLYLSTLSRRPTEQEQSFLLSKINKQDFRSSYNDILWALLNCSEFALNH